MTQKSEKEMTNREVWSIVLLVVAYLLGRNAMEAYIYGRNAMEAYIYGLNHWLASALLYGSFLLCFAAGRMNAKSESK